MVDDGSALQVNPSRVIEDLASETLDVSSLLSSSINVSAFHALPSVPYLYQGSYTVEAGRWPENDHEMVLVLSADGKITDLLLHELGIWDSDHLQQMVQSFTARNSSNVLMNLARQAESTDVSQQKESSQKEEKDIYDVRDFLKLKYRLVLNSGSCSYDEKRGLWTDRSADASYMGEKAAESFSLLTPGVYYRPSLITRLMQEEKNSERVKALRTE